MSILNFFKNRNNKDEDRYILCLDGGGMRGIIPVMVLKKLEELMRKKGADKALQSYFSYIAGTSTGGLIAAGLMFPQKLENTDFNGTKQVNLEGLEQIYMTVGKTIFPASSGLMGFVNKPYQVFANKYPVDGIEATLSSWFGQARLSEASVPTLLMSYNLSDGKAELLKSYDGNGISVERACRATSAAPTYFAPLKNGGDLLADGGVIANNPALFAYLEAKKLYPGCRKFHILSIGTGAQIHKTDPDSTEGLLSWIDQVVPMYTTAQKQATEFAIGQFDDVDYVRIDREFPEPIKLDDARDCVMYELREFGRKLASDSEEKLNEFAEGLVKQNLQ